MNQFMFSKICIDHRVRNTKRLVSTETKRDVWQRDNGNCVICWKTTDDHFHHIKFWSQSIHTKNRNDVDQLVLLCNPCHHALHFEWGNDYRQFCIDYIINYYGNNT